MMKACSTITSALLLVTGSVIAAPSPKPRAPLDTARAAQRIRDFRHARLARLNTTAAVSSDAAAKFAAPTGNIVTSNWGGAQMSGEDASFVESLMNVPSVTFPEGFTPDPSTEYYGCAWIGIDGWTDCNGLFQAGIYWEAPGDGEWTYHAFYEWYPAEPVFTDLVIEPRQFLNARLTVTSPTSGYLVLHNPVTNKTVSQGLYQQEPLCQKTTEWIVEMNVPTQNEFGNFSTVTFERPQSVMGNTLLKGIENATTISLENNGRTWTDCTIKSDSGVNCTFQT